MMRIAYNVDMKTFKATIRKVHPMKMSRNGNRFIRLDFELEDGRFGKTDICPDYRNYPRWQRIIALGAGTSLGLLQIKREGKMVEINADSYPEVLSKPVEKASIPAGPSQPKLI